MRYTKTSLTANKNMSVEHKTLTQRVLNAPEMKNRRKWCHYFARSACIFASDLTICKSLLSCGCMPSLHHANCAPKAWCCLTQSPTPPSLVDRGLITNTPVVYRADITMLLVLPLLHRSKKERCW
jgi:hypothetical protein